MCTIKGDGVVIGDEWTLFPWPGQVLKSLMYVVLYLWAAYLFVRLGVAGLLVAAWCGWRGLKCLEQLGGEFRALRRQGGIGPEIERLAGAGEGQR
ncbi:hypothetical protein ACNQR7_30755 [Mycolicibacterium senegalense]|uniref:hypothetical protein n=1 Tax=Mycolicibacterium senegalense TaxID=1796 RepID=UPI003AAFE6CC